MELPQVLKLASLSGTQFRNEHGSFFRQPSTNWANLAAIEDLGWRYGNKRPSNESYETALNASARPRQPLQTCYSIKFKRRLKIGSLKARYVAVMTT